MIVGIPAWPPVVSLICKEDPIQLRHNTDCITTPAVSPADSVVCSASSAKLVDSFQDGAYEDHNYCLMMLTTRACSSAIFCCSLSSFAVHSARSASHLFISLSHMASWRSQSLSSWDVLHSQARDYNTPMFK